MKLRLQIQFVDCSLQKYNIRGENLMKNKSFIKLVVTFTFFFVGVLCIKSTRASAKSYTFEPFQVTKFNLSNGYLTVKTSSDSYIGIGKNGKKYKRTLKMKVAHDCAWKYKYYQLSNGFKGTEKSSYSKIKDCVENDRKAYVKYKDTYNHGCSTIKVKNGKIVMVEYYMLH